MPRNILIRSADDLLGAHLAARQLASGNRVLYLAQAIDASPGETYAVELDGIIRRCAQRHAREAKSLPGADISRLTVVAVGPDCDGIGRIDEGLFAEDRDFGAVWYFRGEDFSFFRHQRKHGTAEAFISELARFSVGFKELNYVHGSCVADTPGQPAGSWQEEHAALSSHCSAKNILYRNFGTSLVLGEIGMSGARRSHPLLQFLSALYDFKREIEERLVEYFDYQSLRCCADFPDLNLVTAGYAAGSMLRISAQGSPQGEYAIAGTQNITFAELCSAMGRAFGLSLKKTGNRDLLNAVDLLFEQRVGPILSCLCTCPPFSEEQMSVSGMEAEEALYDEELQVALFRLIRRGCFRIRAARDLRAVNVSAALERKALERDGGPLNYYIGGAGHNTIVILNALGHGLHYWQRLIDYLLPRCRIIVWELRGTIGGSRPFRIADQLEDLENILDQEKINVCHLLGWCTGPKIALEFYHRHPAAVSSMVFLNSTFNVSGGSPELKTVYERDFEPLCQIVSDRPQTAPSVMQSLRSSISGDEFDSPEELDSQELAACVLAMTNIHLKSHVLAPFRDEATTVNYSRQILDFLSYDASVNAGNVHAPILLVASENDRIASPAGARAMAPLFPKARFVEVRGATHYCLYDRPELIGRLIQAFLENPDSDAINHLLQ